MPMKRKSLLLRSIAILLFAGSTFATPASTSLVSEDFLTAGDGLLTLDTDTNLEWLDLTLTKGQSYNAVAAGYNGYTTTDGFVFANWDQVATLFTHAGLPDHSGAFLASEYVPALNLISLIGCTGNCGAGADFAEGWAENLTFTAFVTLPFVQAFGPIYGNEGYVKATEGSNSKATVNGSAGSFLIRA